MDEIDRNAWPNCCTKAEQCAAFNMGLDCPMAEDHGEPVEGLTFTKSCFQPKDLEGPKPCKLTFNSANDVAYALATAIADLDPNWSSVVEGPNATANVGGFTLTADAILATEAMPAMQLAGTFGRNVKKAAEAQGFVFEELSVYHLGIWDGRRPVMVCDSKDDALVIYDIAARAACLFQQITGEGYKYTQINAVMDLTATHMNGCPLDLEALLAADDGDFGHDVFGIRRHLDRKTGKLGDCFLPRYAKTEGR